MAIPASLALQTIVDGSDILAAPHRNNYASVQTEFNKLVTMLTGASLGQYLEATGTDWIAAGARYRKTSEKDVVGTAVETDLLNGEITIAANVMGTNRICRALLIGDYLNNTGGNQDFTLKIKLGGIILYQDLVSAISSSANRRPWEIRFDIANLGLTNSQWMNGWHSLGTAVAPTTGIGRPSDAGYGDSNFASSFAIDTTVARALAVTVAHSAANASLSARLKYAVVEVI